ncbi:MAG: prepilin-type cleavage/methylation domain-containing protein [Methylotenera sp.]|nr:MAG: prepilin-type cleavage/methylation domain-containing protein [Methylotenera sp.]
MYTLGNSQQARLSNGVSHKVRLKGFTLIELMITVAIIGILTAIALPNYQQYVIRSSRVAAQSQMMDIANREQQYLLANRVYANKASLGFSLPSEVSAKYTYDITVDNGVSPPTFLITFTPIAGTAQASDGAITLDSKGTKSPLEKW